LDAASPRVDVTAPHRSGHSVPRIRRHRVRRLHREDTTEVEAIPVTTVARTLFDLAEIVDGNALERAFEAAERSELLDLRQIELTCERNPGRRAHKLLRSLLPNLSPAEPTRSELERLFHRLCRLTGLPLPQVNALVEGFEVDAFWPAQRLVLELDSFKFHGTRAAFERDRERDAALLIAGYRVIRITYRRLRDHPDEVAETVHNLLVAA